MARFLTLCILALALTACGGGDAPADDPASAEAPAATQAEAPADTPADALSGTMEDGVQVVRVTAETSGYVPARIQLKAGVPAQLVFTRTTDSACLSQIQIPAFGVEATDLPKGEPVAIAFTPDEAGAFTFMCGMDMQRGTLVVQS
jgi:plastocyanin